MSEKLTYLGTEYVRVKNGDWVATVGSDATTQHLDEVCDFFELGDALANAQRTHTTALATVQALRDDALQERDQVTKELEEIKALLVTAHDDARALRTLLNTYNLGGWTDTVGPVKRALAAEDKLATARADTLREVREKMEKVMSYDHVRYSLSDGRNAEHRFEATLGGRYLRRDDVLAILGGDA